MLNVRFLTLVGIVLAAAAMRMIPHAPNFTPIMAIALFGGAYFANKKAAFAVPLAAMYLSDLFLGFDGSMPFVYGSFALTVCLGLMIQGRYSPLRIGGAALAGSILFFIITNMGVWITGNLYPMTAQGLLTCYIAAIPFFRNTLMGDMVYILFLFGGFAFAQRYFSVLRKGPVPVLGGNA